MHKELEFRGLEFHNDRMWKWESVERALRLMKELDLNALIFHQNDLIDHLVLPSAYFPEDLMWERWPIRRSTNYENQFYIKRVIREAHKLGIAFYMEVKEIWYPGELLEVYPELRTNKGSVCPTDPFWFEFLRKKMEELLTVVPEIDGLIVSPATRESKISISTNPCECRRCSQTTPENWYKGYLSAISEPLFAKDKKLIVRDFSYTQEQQGALLRATRSLSDDIIFALKNVPQDFWPTFPDNKMIGSTEGLQQYIEFDVFGQYCGLGVFPCSLVKDLQQRLRYCLDKGATGVWFRTDWEISNDISVFNSFNMLNLFAGAMLAKKPDLNLNDVYRAWCEYGLFSPLKTESASAVPVIPNAEDAWVRLRDFMEAAWSIIEKTLYVRGNVFQISSKYQHSIDEIFRVMTEYHGLEKWVPGASKAIMCNETFNDVLLEKQEAMEEVKNLSRILDPATLGFPTWFVRDIDLMIELFCWYVEGFHHSARVAFLTRIALDKGVTETIDAAEIAISDLQYFIVNLGNKVAPLRVPHYVNWLLDVRQLELLVKDAHSKLGAIL